MVEVTNARTTPLVRAIHAALMADPLADGREIARRVGCSDAYVSVVRGRYGLRPGFITTGILMSDNENTKWLVREAQRNGVTVPQMLDAILTDARLDSE